MVTMKKYIMNPEGFFSLRVIGYNNLKLIYNERKVNQLSEIQYKI